VEKSCFQNIAKRIKLTQVIQLFTNKKVLFSSVSIPYDPKRKTKGEAILKTANTLKELVELLDNIEGTICAGYYFLGDTQLLITFDMDEMMALHCKDLDKYDTNALVLRIRHVGFNAKNLEAFAKLFKNEREKYNKLELRRYNRESI